MSKKLDYDRIDHAKSEGAADKESGRNYDTPHQSGFFTGIGNTEQQNEENRAYTRGFNQSRRKD